MSFAYQGSELEIFQHATNWKRYYAARLRRYIKGDVLEVGAGLGGTARFLCTGSEKSWTCLEPDQRLLERLRNSLAERPLPVPSEAVPLTLTAVGEQAFDCILYIDVLEHIADDKAQLAACVGKLRPGGHVVVLSPAYQWLFSAFDREIGHHRRYTTRALALAAPTQLQLVEALYLDSVGILASLANRVLLRERYPTLSQIRFWDSVVVPLSRVLDAVCRYRFGKTVIAVWKRPPNASAPSAVS